MTRKLLLAATLLLSACASSAPAPAIKAWSSLEEPAILDVVDKALLAIGNRDAAALKALITGEPTTYFQRRTDAAGDTPVRSGASSGLIPPAGGDPFIERYWDPVVLVRGHLAMVWAPYELRDNGQAVHCGIDGFDMVKLNGQWRIASLISTMEPDACDELQPASVSAMRPRDGWRETPLQ